MPQYERDVGTQGQVTVLIGENRGQTTRAFDLPQWSLPKEAKKRHPKEL